MNALPTPLLRLCRVLGPLALLGCVGLSPLDAQQTQERERLPFVRDAFLLRGATLIDGRGGPPRENTALLIYNGRIQAVGQQERMLLPEGTQVVELEGKYVLPGFVDTRAVPRDAASMQALLFNGITAVLSLGPAASDGTVETVERGGGPGPRIFLAGPPLDEVPGLVPGATLIRDEEEARAAVRLQKDAGTDLVQLYRGLSPPLVRAAVDEAHARDMSVIGDLETTSWIEAARFGIDVLRPIVSRNPDLLPADTRGEYRLDWEAGEAQRVLGWLERVEPEGEAFDDALGALLGTDVTVEPSLVSIESTLFCGHPDYPAPADGQLWWLDDAAGSVAAECINEEGFLARASEAWPAALRLTSVLHEQGVRLLAGSDSPLTHLPPGTAYQRELELLARAGIPPLEVLSIATRNGAIALGRLHEMGTIEVGKRADLVLLGGNPLEDIGATRDVLWVMLEGDVFVVDRGEGDREQEEGEEAH